MSAFVYFIRADAHVKIGSARNVEHRLGALQTSSPHDLEVIGVMPGDVGVERVLHARFAHLRVRGEWFRADDELLAYIAEHCREVEDDVAHSTARAAVTLEAVRVVVERALPLLIAADAGVRARANTVLADVARQIDLHARSGR